MDADTRLQGLTLQFHGDNIKMDYLNLTSDQLAMNLSDMAVLFAKEARSLTNAGSADDSVEWYWEYSALTLLKLSMKASLSLESVQKELRNIVAHYQDMNRDYDINVGQKRVVSNHERYLYKSLRLLAYSKYKMVD